MPGIEDGRSIPGGETSEVSRGRFLRLAGLGVGLSLFPGSLFPARPARSQVVGEQGILSPNGPYPIVAWWPPPPVPNTNPEPQAETDRRYAELAGAGFNAVIGGNGVGNNRANGLALNACESNGIRLVLADNDLSNAIKGTATPATTARAEGQEEPEGVLQTLTEQDSRQDIQAQAAANRTAITQRLQELHDGSESTRTPAFGNRPGLAGIFLYDEPGRTLFPDLRFARQEVERIFGFDELPYVNVWPSYASPRNALQAPSYGDYLNYFMDEARYPASAVVPPFLSFDHYPLLANGRITPDFFFNHAVIRNFSLRFGVPSWGFVQSMGFDGRAVGLAPRRRPNENELFWQINVALAYGVKGIQYFTYWTPANNKIRFGEALITRAGTRTALYASATRANDFLRKVGAVLLPLTSTSVTHALEPRPPRGAQRFRGNPYIGGPTGSPVILSFFDDPTVPNTKYLLVTNRAPNRASRTRLTVSSSVLSVDAFDPSAGVSGDGDFVSVPLSSTPPRYLPVVLGPGRARLYRFRTA